MAGTRTAPAVTGAVTSGISTLHLVDASGDSYTDSMSSLALPVAADMEAWATAYQAATQASIWKITNTWVWEGDKDADNAETNQRSTVAEGINMLYKNVATLKTTTPRLVAPIGAVMQGNQDIPLLSAAEMVALILAQSAILQGYNLQSAQFTGRRERSNNPRISV